jgi:hypothetical protein
VPQLNAARGDLADAVGRRSRVTGSCRRFWQAAAQFQRNRFVAAGILATSRRRERLDSRPASEQNGPIMAKSVQFWFAPGLIVF